MHMHRIRTGAHKALRAGTVMAGLLLAALAYPALAQSNPPAPADAAPSEAARRQALGPYRFILQNASAPARAKPAAEKPAAAEPKRPAAEPPVAARTRPLSPSPSDAPASQPAPLAQPVPEPVAALAPKPAEPPAPARREIIAVKTDEPRLSAALMRERPSGVVKVAFEVHPDGTTKAARVVSSTNRALNRATIEAVSGWTFEPVDEVMAVETEVAYKYD